MATTEFLRAVVGIVCVGALNLGVSFGLALAVALRARGAFFLPPRNP